MRISTWTAAMAVLAVWGGLAGQLEAQDPGQQRGMMGQGMMQMCSVMSGQGVMSGQNMMGMIETAGLRRGPAALLAVADELALSDEQVERLEALEERSSKEHGTHMRAAMQAQRETFPHSHVDGFVV